MNNTSITAKGTNGTIVADNEKITISRSGFAGFVTQGIKGDRIIFYKDLKSIEYQKPGIIVNGYIQFITSTEMATQRKTNILTTPNSVAKDPNIVLFHGLSKTMAEESAEIYSFMMDNLEKYKNSDNSSNTSNFSTADEITKFKKLLDDNVITEEEFDKKKSELLNM